MVGTTVKNVMGCLDELGLERKGAPSRSHTAVVLKGYWNSMVAPAKRGVRRAFTVPWM